MTIRTIATIYHAEGVRFDDIRVLDENLMDGQATMEPIYSSGAATLPGWKGPFVIDPDNEILIADSQSRGEVAYGSSTEVRHHWTRTVTETILRHLVAGELVIEIMKDDHPAVYLVITPGAYEVRAEF